MTSQGLEPGTSHCVCPDLYRCGALAAANSDLARDMSNRRSAGGMVICNGIAVCAAVLQSTCEVIVQQILLTNQASISGFTLHRAADARREAWAKRGSGSTGDSRPISPPESGC
ncbi:hypothetical protein OPT61_g5807 [Boeremia exigua]|uniref:Uncharacterized protein n=1 Tax=Boeremia exigua TaxID=749465 RepID=A0ACC2I8Y2_9PLEO|nr:hypothetical protein OPT61_g5807 [Boeremia exigua]